MLQPDGHLDVEMVSAWLDTPEDFSAADRLVIEEHLATCAECRQIAADLTAIVHAFQALPLVATSRSYALTPEMAGLTRTPTLPASRLEEPAHPHERQSRQPVASYEHVAWYEQWMGRLRWATAVAAIMFVFVFSADLLGNIDTTGDHDDDAAMVTDQPFKTDESEESAAGAAPAAATEAAASVPEEESADDSVRSADETTNAAGEAEEEAADSGELATTESTGGGSSAEPEPTPAIEEEESEEAPPAQGGDEPTSDEAETLMTLETAEPGQEEFAQQEDQTIAAYNAEQAAAEDSESNVLHILELALIITIAWLLVAMIALPRLRRTGT
jgi:hypothetical protein